MGQGARPNGHNSRAQEAAEETDQARGITCHPVNRQMRLPCIGRTDARTTVITAETKRRRDADSKLTIRGSGGNMGD